MRNIHKIILVISMALTVCVTKAQNVSPVDFMCYNPYQLNANPAADLPYKSVMSILIGNVDYSIQNTTLRYYNLFEFDAQGCPKVVSLTQFANSLKDDNSLLFDSHLDLFTLFTRLNKGMLTFNYGLRVQGNAAFNDGLVKLLAYGNGSFVGDDNPATINLRLNLNGFQEFAVGYQVNITQQFSLGGRAKLLFGLANVTTDAFNVQLFTDPDSYALRLRESVAMRASLPNVFYVDESGNLETYGPFSAGELFRNLGFGIDLAAEYRFNEHFSAVAAVRDLGFIHWGGNNIGLSGDIQDAGQFYDNGDFFFEGLSIDELKLVASDESYRELFLDTLRNYFQMEFAPIEAYNAALNTNVMLRGNYDINAHHRFSAQMQGRFADGGFRPAFTVAYCGSFWDNFNVCTTYTAMKDSYDNFGLGLSAMIGTCNIYLTTSNVFAFFKPLHTSAMNLQMGIVFNMFEKAAND